MKSFRIANPFNNPFNQKKLDYKPLKENDAGPKISAKGTSQSSSKRPSHLTESSKRSAKSGLTESSKSTTWVKAAPSSRIRKSTHAARQSQSSGPNQASPTSPQPLIGRRVTVLNSQGNLSGKSNDSTPRTATFIQGSTSTSRTSTSSQDATSRKGSTATRSAASTQSSKATEKSNSPPNSVNLSSATHQDFKELLNFVGQKNQGLGKKLNPWVLKIENGNLTAGPKPSVLQSSEKKGPLASDRKQILNQFKTAIKTYCQEQDTVLGQKPKSGKSLASRAELIFLQERITQFADEEDLPGINQQTSHPLDQKDLDNMNKVFNRIEDAIKTIKSSQKKPPKSDLT